MDASERRRTFLVQLSPWLGFMVGAAGFVLGVRAISAGLAGQPLGYGLGAFELGVTYVAGRRAWTQTIDRVFVGASLTVIGLAVAILTLLDLPATIFA